MPKVFGIEHFLYLLVTFTISIVLLFIIKKYVKSEQKLRLIIRITGIVLLLAIIWNRIAITKVSGDYADLLPNSFCGTSSFVFSLCLIILPRDHKIFHFIMYCAFLGGALTLIYPDFIGQDESIFYEKTISGLLHHSIMFYGFFLLILTKYFVPDEKKWYILPQGLFIYITYGVFCITIVGLDDAMQIREPLLEGTIFNWFFTGLLFLILHMLFLLIYKYFRDKKHDNKKIVSESEYNKN